MEPTIKYENCEEIYTGPSTLTDTNNHSAAEPLTASIKRTYGEMTGAHHNASEAFTPSTYQLQMQSVYQQRGYFQMPGVQQTMQHFQQQQSNITPNPKNGLKQHFQPHQQEQQLPLSIASPSPNNTTKRRRGGEGNVLFGPPFFELVSKADKDAQSGVLTARCLSCHVMLRGSRNVSSNFIKHMKRVHPEMHKIYEGFKLFRHRAGYAAAELNMKWNVGESGPKYESEQNSLNSDVPEPFVFDANAFLETVARSAGGAANPDHEHNSETTDNSGTPPDCNAFLENLTRATGGVPNADDEHNSEITDNSNTPPESHADIIEANDNSVDLQQTSKEQPKAVTENAQVDLSQKTLQLMSRMFDEKLKAFVTKREFEEQTQQGQANNQPVTKAEQKTNPPATTALEAQLTSLQQQLETLQQRLKQTEQSKRHMQCELQTLDRVLHRRRLIVRNIKLEDNEKPQAAVEQLFRERLSLPEVDVQKVTLLTGGGNKTQSGKHHVLVEVKDERDARAIFRECKRLRGSDIFIESQMSPYARKRKSKLLVLRKELLRRNSELKVMVRNTQLLVGGQQFYWDEVEGLCVGNLNSGAVEQQDQNAVEQLKELTKQDLKEFLSVLKNYNVR